MNKIDRQLEKINSEKRIGLMTHVVVGYPTIDATEDLIVALVKGGSDFIELQIPFSDPIADGPTIMQASDIALKNGANVETAFEIMASVSQKVTVPLLFMGYYNTVFNYGVEKFCKKAAQTGASGLIIPDMSLDEEPHEKFLFYCDRYNLYPIRVISPASTDQRLRLNAKNAKGFVYCISRFGVTGSSNDLDSRLAEYLKKVRSYFKVPISVGFGISKREHIQALKEVADIAIMGSALIDLVANHPETEDFSYVTEFLKQLV